MHNLAHRASLHLIGGEAVVSNISLAICGCEPTHGSTGDSLGFYRARMPVTAFPEYMGIAESPDSLAAPGLYRDSSKDLGVFLPAGVQRGLRACGRFPTNEQHSKTLVYSREQQEECCKGWKALSRDALHVAICTMRAQPA